jgi:hypothetical protein
MATNTSTTYTLHGQFRCYLGFILSIDVFSVRGFEQIVWTQSRFNKAPNLYVEIRLEQSVWCTRIVKRSATPTWDEEFPM